MRSNVKVYIVTNLTRGQLELLFQRLLQQYQVVSDPQEADLLVVDLDHLPEEAADRPKVISLCGSFMGRLFLAQLNSAKREPLAAYLAADRRSQSSSADLGDADPPDPTESAEPVALPTSTEDGARWLLGHFYTSLGFWLPTQGSCDELLAAMRWWESQFAPTPLDISPEARARWFCLIADLAIDALRMTDVLPGTNGSQHMH